MQRSTVRYRKSQKIREGQTSASVIFATFGLASIQRIFFSIRTTEIVWMSRSREAYGGN